jgi:hypothetical protein
MPFQIRRSVGVHREIRGNSSVYERTNTHGSSGNSGEILVEVVIGGRDRSCALSEDSDLSCFRDTSYTRKTWTRRRTYLARISAERCDVNLHPLESGPLVVQAEVEHTSFHSLRPLRESERSKAIVDGHKQDWCALREMREIITKLADKLVGMW